MKIVVPDLSLNEDDLFDEFHVYKNIVACRLKADYMSQRGRPFLSNVYN
jgi:hypothetical protein